MNQANLNDINIGMRTRLDLPYEAAVERVTAALKDEGFGVLTQIDVKATLKQKLDVDFRRYIILGACNPSLAYRAFSAELEIGLLLPCNVIVYEDEDGRGSMVSIVNPIAMLGIAAAPGLAVVGEEAAERLQRVLSILDEN